MARQFAVFDIDGTLVRTSLLQLVVRELVNKGALDGAVAGDIERLLHDSRMRIGDDELGGYMNEAVKMMIDHSSGGLTVQDYQDAIANVARSLNTHTYVYTRQLVDTLRKNDFFLIAISGSEQRVVQAVSAALGFHTCAAGVYYSDNGTHITGEVKRFAAAKNAILQAILEKHQLGKRGSLAVGDTGRDIPVFDMVDQPIAFNPNQELFKAARDKNWMVVLERKDVVYGLQQEDGKYILKSVNV